MLGWIALAIALLVPFVIATPYALNVMTTAAIFVLLASGLNIVVGYCGLLDLGYIAFMAVGAYTSGIIAKAFELPLIFTHSRRARHDDSGRTDHRCADSSAAQRLPGHRHARVR